MQFKKWLEHIIDREDAKKMVLSAVGAGDIDPTEEGDVLTAAIGAHPDLETKLKSFSHLSLYIDDIISFIRTNRHKTLVDLINFIQNVDDGNSPGVPRGI